MDIELPWQPVHKIVSFQDLVVLIAGSRYFPVKNGALGSSRSHEETIRAASFNEDGTMFVTGGDDKLVSVWDTKTWTCLGQRKSEKKVTGVALKDSKVIWSDRTGTVCTIPVERLGNEQEKSSVLLGHCSWITEMSIVPYNKTHLILTSDRDEKIRVSYYPDGYDIFSYCLGHTTFVSSICVFSVNDKSVLFSGGAENSIYVWNFVNGELFSKFTIENAPEKDPIIRQIIALDQSHIAVLVEEHNAIEVLEVSFNNEKYSLSKGYSIKLNSRPFALEVVDKKLWVSTIDGLFVVDEGHQLKELEITKQIQNFFEPKVQENFDEIFSNLSMKMLRRYFGSEQNNEKKKEQNAQQPAKKKRKRVGGKNVNNKKDS